MNSSLAASAPLRKRPCCREYSSKRDHSTHSHISSDNAEIYLAERALQTACFQVAHIHEDVDEARETAAIT